MRITKYLRFYFIITILVAKSALLAQPQNIKFNKLVHDFGDIMLNSGHHKYKFTFQNIGKEPLVIQTVISSCGCTTPVWTKKPVMPGEQGFVEITYLNNQGAYPFDKALTVYVTGEAAPVILRLRGVVHEKPKPLNALFPENFGGISFRSPHVDMGHMLMGDIKEERIEVANTSAGVVDFKILSHSKGLTVIPSNQKLKPGEKGEVIFRLNSKESNQWGRTWHELSIHINGREYTKRAFRVGVFVKDNFTGLSKEEQENGPLPMATSSNYDFGTVKAGTIAKASFQIKNVGKREYLIHKVESDSPNIKYKHPSTIPAGGGATIEAFIETAGQSGDRLYYITLIGNSPLRPIINLVVTGKIVK